MEKKAKNRKRRIFMYALLKFKIVYCSSKKINIYIYIYPSKKPIIFIHINIDLHILFQNFNIIMFVLVKYKTIKFHLLNFKITVCSPYFHELPSSLILNKKIISFSLPPSLPLPFQTSNVICNKQIQRQKVTELRHDSKFANTICVS